MDWWTSGAGCEQVASGHLLAGAEQQACVFDPWLASTCDELDLGIILNQAATSSCNSASGDEEASTPVGELSAGAEQQQQLHEAESSSQRPASTQLEEEHSQQQQQQQYLLHPTRHQLNKRDIVNILNNSSKHNCAASASSTANSPVSSLNSSPPVSSSSTSSGANSNCVSIFGPASSYAAHNSFQTHCSKCAAPSGDQANLVARCNSLTCTCEPAAALSLSSDFSTTQHHQNQQQNYHQHHSRAHLLAGAQAQLVSTKAAYCAAGSSLLNSARSQPSHALRGQRAASSASSGTTTTTTSTATKIAPSITATDQAQQGGQKMRRCRHITDFVLAEEERRLLIKEGYTDFPMSCQARPLSKNEERILRKIRRKIRNKKSAQCSRQRKKEYVEELERKYAAIVVENDQLKQMIQGLQQQQQQQMRHKQQEAELDEAGQQFADQHEHSSSLASSGHQHSNHSQQQQQQLHNNSRHAPGNQHNSSGPELIDWKDLFPHSTAGAVSRLVQSSNGAGLY